MDDFGAHTLNLSNRDEVVKYMYDDENYISMYLYDGFHATIEISKDDIIINTANKLHMFVEADLRSMLRDLFNAMDQTNENSKFIFDGIILPSADSNELSSRIFYKQLTKKEHLIALEDFPTFVVLDVMHYYDRDLRDDPFSIRYQILMDLLSLFMEKKIVFPNQFLFALPKPNLTSSSKLQTLCKSNTFGYILKHINSPCSNRGDKDWFTIFRSDLLINDPGYIDERKPVLLHAMPLSGSRAHDAIGFGYDVENRPL